MLQSLTVSQYAELRAFFRVKQAEEEEQKQLVQESRLRGFFGRKIAQQQGKRK